MAEEGKDPRRPQDDDGLSDLARAYRTAAPYLYVGWTLAASTLLGTLGGYWLDGKLDTSPLFLILGALLGIGAGFVELIRTVRKIK